jgi:hypothetical protein
VRLASTDRSRAIFEEELAKLSVSR